MKQLLILSGKGGTGKTTVASSFIKLSKNRVYADCDIDAPNLHLITKQESEPIRNNYYGLPKAVIDENKCIGCGTCYNNCKFNAIKLKEQASINPYACEGCGVCEIVCLVGAIKLVDDINGKLELYINKDDAFSTGKLKMGSGTSGKLVTEVKKQLKQVPKDYELAIIDGSPGIGCPVIASISGVDMVLIVAEPSVSGISDMQRIIKTAKNFGIKIAVCVNKFDTNIENTNKIERYCEEEELPFVGKIPFDKKAVEAINNNKSIVELDCKSGTAVRRIYDKTMKLLFNHSGNNI